MLIGTMGRAALCSAALLLAGCAETSLTDLDRDLAEMPNRPVTFADYPQPGTTYLSFSQSHGFQVNFIDKSGRAWLWYPGNTRAVPETWRMDASRGALCWGHPTGSYNPVTGQQGGESCESLADARRLVIARLGGDPYNLASGRVPYPLEKCRAPAEFDYDRQRYGCA